MLLVHVCRPAAHTVAAPPLCPPYNSGYYFTVYGGRGGSIILIEELTTDTDNSNN